MTRQFQFKGDDASYIRFLEKKVVELESKLRARSSDQLERVKRNLDAFLGEIPHLRDWTNISYDSPANTSIILKALIGHGTHLRADLTPVPDGSDITTLLHSYTKLTIDASLENAFLQCLKYFRELVLVSLFAVVLKVVCPDDTDAVFDIMRDYMNSQKKTKAIKPNSRKVTEKTLRKHVQGAVWANRMIFALSLSPWGSKCSFCFFIAGQPISFYARYAELSESRTYLSQRMQEKSANPPDSRLDHQEADDDCHQASSLTPLAIPLIIEELMGGNVSLQKICDSLGYDFHYITECRPLYTEALSREQTISPSEERQPSDGKRTCPFEGARVSKRRRPKVFQSSMNRFSIHDNERNEMQAQTVDDARGEFPAEASPDRMQDEAWVFEGSACTQSHTSPAPTEATGTPLASSDQNFPPLSPPISNDLAHTTPASDSCSSPISEASFKLRVGWNLTHVGNQTQRARCQHCRVTKNSTEGSLPSQAQDDTSLTVDSSPSINVPVHLHRTDPTTIFAPLLNTASHVPTADLSSNIIPNPPGRSTALAIPTEENTSMQVPHSDTNRGANPSSAPEQAALQELSRGDSTSPTATFLENESQELLEALPGQPVHESCQFLSLEPRLDEQTPQGENHGSSAAWFSTYSLGGSITQENIDLSNAWFSTYSNSRPDETVAQGENVGTGEAWFTTYLNPQIQNSTAQNDEFELSNVWFSTYPNPQLGESTQTDDIDLDHAWFTICPNS